MSTDAADESADSTSSSLPYLLRLYIPVLLFSLLIPAVAGGIIALVIGKAWALVFPAIFVTISGLHLVALFFLTTRKLKKREKDWFEMKLEPEFKIKLREFVVEIGRRWNMPRPDDICLSAESAAHVYESKKGKRTLVIGGMAIAALSREALAAVIAHELTHFEGGDPAFPWEKLGSCTMMLPRSEQLGNNSAHLIDPAVWPLAVFHFYVTVQQARHSREREFRCDARSATHAGPAPTAAALIYLHVVNEMPWANMMSVLATAAT